MVVLTKICNAASRQANSRFLWVDRIAYLRTEKESTDCELRRIFIKVRSLLVNCEVHILHMFVYYFDYGTTKSLDRKPGRDFACTTNTLSTNDQSLF